MDEVIFSNHSKANKLMSVDMVNGISCKPELQNAGECTIAREMNR